MSASFNRQDAKDAKMNSNVTRGEAADYLLFNRQGAKDAKVNSNVAKGEAESLRSNRQGAKSAKKDQCLRALTLGTNLLGDLGALAVKWSV